MNKVDKPINYTLHEMMPTEQTFYFSKKEILIFFWALQKAQNFVSTITDHLPPRPFKVVVPGIFLNIPPIPCLEISDLPPAPP